MSSAGMDPDMLQPNGVLNNLSKCDSLETQMLKSGIPMSMSTVPPSRGSDSESDCRRGEDKMDLASLGGCMGFSFETTEKAMGLV